MSSKATDRKQYLDPMERSMEVLFGLIGVLTYTGSLSVQHAGHHAVDRMLVAALGCNLAWGVVDGWFYTDGVDHRTGAADQARPEPAPVPAPVPAPGTRLLRLRSRPHRMSSTWHSRSWPL